MVEDHGGEPDAPMTSWRRRNQKRAAWCDCKCHTEQPFLLSCVAALMIALDATDEEMILAWDIMQPWPLPNSPLDAARDVRRAIGIVREN